MSDYLPEIPAGTGVEETCDYCRRQFVRRRGAPAICLNCGVENVREQITQPETAMVAPGAERAVLPTPKARRLARKRSA